MKACPHCSTTYDDRVDFCFRDGTPLEVAAEPVTSTPEIPPSDLPEPVNLVAAALPGGPSFEEQIAVPQPSGFAPEPQKSAPVTREARPLDSAPEEELDGPEPLDAPAPQSEAQEEEEVLEGPVAIPEDPGIDQSALPPLSEPEEPPVVEEKEPVSPVLPPVDEAPSKPPPVDLAPERNTVEPLPPFVDEDPEPRRKGGGMFLLLGAGAAAAAAVGIGLFALREPETSAEPVASVPEGGVNAALV